MGQQQSNNSRHHPYSERHRRESRNHTHGLSHGESIQQVASPQFPETESNSQGRQRRRTNRRRPLGLGNSQPDAPTSRAVSVRQWPTCDNDHHLELALNAGLPVDLRVHHVGSVAEQVQEAEAAGGLPSSQTLKLEMNINTADGSIDGKVLLGETNSSGGVASPPGTVDVPQQQHVCSVCHGQVDILHVQHPRRHKTLRELLEDAELNEIYREEGLQYLHRTYMDLATDVGDVVCDETIGLIKERKYLKEKIFWQYENPDIFTGIRKFIATGILLFGEEGNGKTRLAKLITHHIGSKYLNIHPYYLDSPARYKRLVNIFRLAAQNEPTVVVFESVDQTFGKNKVLQEVLVNEFRRCIDQDKSVIIVGTMNSCPHNLPHRVSDCFEHKINIPMPRTYERVEFVKHHMRNTCHTLEERDIKEIAALTRYFTRSKMITLCRQAASKAVHESHSMHSQEQSFQVRSVTKDDFLRVLKKIDCPPDPCVIRTVSSSASTASDSSDDTLVDMAELEEDLNDEDRGVDEVD